MVDLTDREVVKDTIIECNMCGITLMVTEAMPNEEVQVEIVDEGK